MQGKYEKIKLLKKNFQEKEQQNNFKIQQQQLEILQQQNQIQILQKKIEKYQLLKSEYKQARISVSGSSQSLQQPNQKISLQNIQSSSEIQSKMVSDLKEQCFKLEQQLNSEKSNNQKLTNKLKNYETLKKECDSLKQEQITQDQYIKDLKKKISEQDQNFLQKIERRENELQNLKSSKIELQFRHKLLRLIELIPRLYFQEIKFAIKYFNNNGAFKSLQSTTENLQVYQIEYTKKVIKQLLFAPSYEEIAGQIIIKQSNNMKGTLSSPIEQITHVNGGEGRIIEQLKIFQSNPIEQQFFLNSQKKVFALKTIKNTTFNQQYEEKQSILYENSREDAIKQIANLMVSQEILNEFQQDLIAFGKKIEYKHQFTNFSIVSTSHSFKEIIVFIKKSIVNQNTIPRAFHFLYDFVLSLNQEVSNNFFGQLEEIQCQLLENQKKKQPILIKPAFKNFLELQKCQSQVINNLQNYTEQEVIDAINFFWKQNYDFPKVYPFEKFYPAYEINFDINQTQELVQYNGGFLTIDNTLKESSYYWALSYYSIVKTNESYLYEPLISTQDGFFSSTDQGLREIRTIESLSSKYYPEWKSFFDWLSKKSLE